MNVTTHYRHDTVKRGRILIDYMDAMASGLELLGTVKALGDSDYDLMLYDDKAFGLPAVIDGVKLRRGDRVLILNQKSSFAEGIWLIEEPGIGGYLVRPYDFNSNKSTGAFVYVEEGATHSATGWVLVGDWVAPSPMKIIQERLKILKQGKWTKFSSVGDTNGLGK